MKFLPVVVLLLATAIVSAADEKPAPPPAAPAATPPAPPVPSGIQAANLHEAAMQFAKQTGVAIRSAEEKPAALKFEIKKGNPLDVLADFITRSGATFDIDSPTPESQIVPAPAPLVSRKLGDKLLLMIDRVTLQANQPMVQPPQPPQPLQETITINGTIIPDPSLEIVALHPNPRLIERQDDLAIRGQAGQVRMFTTLSPRPYNAFPFSMQFTAEKRLDKLTEVRGRLVAWQAFEWAQARFNPDQLIDTAAINNNGLLVTPSVTVEPEGKRVIKLVLSGPVIDQYMKEPNDRGLIRAVSVHHKDGAVALNITTLRKRRTIEMSISSADQPATMLAEMDWIQVRVPTKVRQIELPFALKDLPLP